MRVTNEIDAELGRRLRQARLSANLTQERLAKKIEISFQQVQKYENGTNRISSSRLLAVSEALNLPVGYFFEGLHKTEGEAFPDRIIRAARILDELPDGMIKDQILLLIKAVSNEGKAL